MTATPETDRQQSPDAVPDAIEVVRSEERLQVGRTVRVSSRAVLRVFVVTETVSRTFETRREEVRLDLEPLTGTEAEGEAEVVGGVMFDERMIEVVLHREVPVVHLQVEATERVRLYVDTITEQISVEDDARREQVELEAPAS